MSKTGEGLLPIYKVPGNLDHSRHRLFPIARVCAANSKHVRLIV